MPSSTYYRDQAHRCLLLSRATVDPKARLWLTDMATYYASKASVASEMACAGEASRFPEAGALQMLRVPTVQL